jgi:monoamine oxidase
MSSDDNRYDTIVIGGGFAGAVAARDLTEEGHRVLLLEARDRLGGRTYSSKFPGTDIDVELGGQFLVPAVYPFVMAEIERYGFAYSDLPEPESIETILNGKRYAGMLPPLEQMYDIERAALHCIKAASRIDLDKPLDSQGIEDLDVSLADFLAPLNLAPETYDFVVNVASEMTFMYPDEPSAIVCLRLLTLLDLSVINWLYGVSTNTRMGALVTRIAEDATEVRLNSPVARVDQTGEDVLVTTVEGETFAASTVVVATPVELWKDIEFAPELSETKRVTSAESHSAKRTSKAILRVRPLPTTSAVIANPRWTDGGFQLYSEKEFDNGDHLINLFAWSSIEGDDYHFDVEDRESIERVLEKMLPGTQLIEFYSHNWVTDPYSQGAHIVWRPGHITKSHTALAAAEGRLVFATADIALRGMHTIEGAAESGHRAAQQTLQQLRSGAEPAAVASS